jgi:group I intron endonuclease
MKNYISTKSPISHKYLNHGKYVPIQKYSKFNSILYISIRNYTTLSNSSSNSVITGLSLQNKALNTNLQRLNYLYPEKILNFLAPHKKYDDAYNMKKEIYLENLNKSGIYMLTNKLTNDIYVGQSINLSKRFRNYFNINYIKSKENFKINKALIKYGYLNFSITILEYCDKSNLILREQYYLDKLNPQYNILKVAGSSLNYRHSEETKAKISKTLKEIYMQKKYSSISSKNKTLFNTEKLKYTEETYIKIKNQQRNTIFIYEKCSSKGFELIGSFVSARRAAKFLDISGNTVIKYKNSGEIYKDRYKFSCSLISNI